MARDELTYKAKRDCGICGGRGFVHVRVCPCVLKKKKAAAEKKAALKKATR